MTKEQLGSVQRIAALNARVASLEAQARRHRYVQLALVLAAVSALTVAAARPAPDRISAQVFTLLDANGNECAVWSSAPPQGQEFGSARLVFRRSNEDGGAAVTLDAGAGTPSLVLQGRSSSEHGLGDASASLRVDRALGPQLLVRSYQSDPTSQPTCATLETVIGLPYAAAAKCLVAKRGATEVWSAP